MKGIHIQQILGSKLVTKIMPEQSNQFPVLIISAIIRDQMITF